MKKNKKLKPFVQEQRAFNQTSDPRVTMMMIVGKKSVDCSRKRRFFVRENEEFYVYVCVYSRVFEFLRERE